MGENWFNNLRVGKELLKWTLNCNRKKVNLETRKKNIQRPSLRLGLYSYSSIGLGIIPLRVCTPISPSGLNLLSPNGVQTYPPPGLTLFPPNRVWTYPSIGLDPFFFHRACIPFPHPDCTAISPSGLDLYAYTSSGLYPYLSIRLEPIFPQWSLDLSPHRA